MPRTQNQEQPGNFLKNAPRESQVSGSVLPVELALVLPSVHVAANHVSMALRLLEALLVFGAATSVPPERRPAFPSIADCEHYTLLRMELQGSLVGYRSPVPLSSSENRGLHLIWIEEWVRAGLPSHFDSKESVRERAQLPLLPIEDIRKGSYEFIFSAVNLVAIFGLQDMALFKDVVQWVCSILHGMASDTQFRHVIRRGDGYLRITPEMLIAMEAFDSVELIEERTATNSKFVVRLSRHSRT